jgi:hypothetical protein
MKYKVPIISLASLLDLLFILIFAMQIQSFKSSKNKLEQQKTKHTVEIAKKTKKQLENEKKNKGKFSKLSIENEFLESKSKKIEKLLEKEKRKSSRIIKDITDIYSKIHKFKVDKLLNEKSSKEEIAKKIKKLLEKMHDDEFAQRIIQYKQMKAVEKIVVFWNIKLNNDNTVTISVGKKRKKFSCKDKNKDFSKKKFFANIEKFVSKEIGEPTKSHILITYGFSMNSTYIVFEKLESAIKEYKPVLEKQYKKNFHLDNVEFIPGTVK